MAEPQPHPPPSGGAATPSAPGVVEVELVQSLGLLEASTIGIGTMIGAGIFVLPGFIVAAAGPAAVLSFLLGGVVALFAAMSAAEVATGMPKSGGGYYVISRAMGPLWGAVIGWGSWFGLVFATAFYAVGFGEYVRVFVPLPVGVLALGMTAALVALNLVGTRAAGQAQNLIVVVLVLVLALFIVAAAPEAQPTLITSDFAPFGLGAVAGGTATLFVTYCGFGEIASMAEEIRDPGRNLPRALVGSVVSVTVLYCLVVLACLAMRPYDQLQSPTLVADLAGDLMGTFGTASMLAGAVLATVSSANASIMSASRISFAMGRDEMMWPWMNVVHPRFRVPHRAVLVTGALILLVILIGDIELLAEAAGLLHLLMYGLMSVACIVLRGARPMGYRPIYRVPLYPLLPILGAGGTLFISLFISPLVMAMGVTIAALAVLHYWLWARRRTAVRGAWPFFLRRGILEPALERVERWGAPPDDLPTAIVTVRNPRREAERLALAAAIMQQSRGSVLALNIFVLRGEERLRQEVFDRYVGTIGEREEALRRTVEPITRTGVRVTSHVAPAQTVLRGIVSATEVARASLLLLGWPEPGPEGGGGIELYSDLERTVRTHLLVFREGGITPPRRVLVLVDRTSHAQLALLLAARASAAWGAELVAATVVPRDADADACAEAEADLEARIGTTVWTRVRALAAESVEEAVREAARVADLIALGVSAGGDRGLVGLMSELEPVMGRSLLLVRAHPSIPVEPWM